MPILPTAYYLGGFFDVLVPIPLCSATGSPWPLLLVALLMIAVCLAAHPAARRWFGRAVTRSFNVAPLVVPGPPISCAVRLSDRTEASIA